MNSHASKQGCSIEEVVGHALHQLRGMRKMSLLALSDRTGIAILNIAAIEKGRAQFRAGQVRALARALRCHPSVLALFAARINRPASPAGSR